MHMPVNTLDTHHGTSSHEQPHANVLVCRSAIRIQMAFRRWQHHKQVSARRATFVRWLLGGLCAATTSCLASMSVDASPAKRRVSQPTLLEQEVREETGQVLRAVHAESTSKPRAADYGEAHWEALEGADMV